MTAFRSKRKWTAARGRIGVGHDREIKSGVTPQPQRSRQLVEQRLCFRQVGGIEALGEPGVDGSEKVAGFGRYDPTRQISFNRIWARRWPQPAGTRVPSPRPSSLQIEMEIRAIVPDLKGCGVAVRHVPQRLTLTNGLVRQKSRITKRAAATFWSRWINALMSNQLAVADNSGAASRAGNKVRPSISTPLPAK